MPVVGAPKTPALFKVNGIRSVAVNLFVTGYCRLRVKVVSFSTFPFVKASFKIERV